MRSFLILALAAVLAWAVYWAIGSASATHAYETWFEDRRAEGWVAEYDTLETTGFPDRFDTLFTDISVADPDTGLAWDAPSLQILAQSYRPNHITIIWPATHRLSTPLAKFDLQSRDMRAGLVTRPAPNLPLDQLTLSTEAVAVRTPDSAQPTTAQQLNLMVERSPDVDNQYRVNLSADGFAPALDWRVKLDPSGTLPDTLEALSLDTNIEFDRPWDMTAIEEARPQPRNITLRLADARWGRLEVQAAGAVSIDANGIPRGDVTIKARNWREILRLAVSSGALPQGFGDTLEDGLALVSQLAGNPKTLDIPLSLRGGRVFLGPVPLGPAPVLRLR